MDTSKRDAMKFGLIAIGTAFTLPGCGGGGDSSTGGSTAPGATARKGEVSGNVAENRNSSTGSLEGIGVSVGGVGTTTDAGGRFSIKDAPEGNQEVVFQTERSEFAKQSGPVFNATVTGSITVNIPADGSIEFRNVRIQDDVVVADEIITIAEDGTRSSVSGGSLPPRTPDPEQGEGQSIDIPTTTSSVPF